MKKKSGTWNFASLLIIGILINCGSMLLGPEGKERLEITYYKLLHSVFPIQDFPDAGSGVIEVRKVVNGTVVDEEVQLKSTVQTTHEQLPKVIESRIDGHFTGFEKDGIYKLTNGQIWHQTDQTRLPRFAINPKVTLEKNGAFYNMSAPEIDQPVKFQLLRDGRGTASYTVSKNVMEEEVTNPFTGFRKGNIFRLKNGQIWEQIEDYTKMVQQHNPKIIIYKVGGICRLSFDRIDHAVRVERVK